MASVPELTDKVHADRLADPEGFETQIEAARQSVDRGNYAVARAELRGAILFLDRIEKRDPR